MKTSVSEDQGLDQNDCDLSDKPPIPSGVESMSLKRMSRVLVVCTLVLGVTSFVYSYSFPALRVNLWVQLPIDPPETSIGFLSNGPNSNGDGDLTQVAEDFDILESATPTLLRWQGFYHYDSAADLTPRWFQIRIWSTGKDGLPLRQVYTLNRYVPVTNSGISNGYGEPIYNYSATLPSVGELEPGKYWIAVIENDPNTTLAWCWSDSDNTESNPDLNHRIAFRDDRKSPWQFFDCCDAAFQLQGRVN